MSTRPNFTNQRMTPAVKSPPVFRDPAVAHWRCGAHRNTIKAEEKEPPRLYAAGALMVTERPGLGSWSPVASAILEMQPGGY